MLSPISVRKAQVFVSDFAFSALIFLLLIGVSFYMYDSLVERKEYVAEMQNTLSIAEDISYKLLKHTGIPPNWNLDNLQSVGFADEENVLNFTKLYLFSSLPYEKGKYLLTSQETYEVYINISSANELWSYGIRPPLNTKEIYRVNRIGILNDSVVLITIYLWR